MTAYVSRGRSRSASYQGIRGFHDGKASAGSTVRKRGLTCGYELESRRGRQVVEHLPAADPPRAIDTNGGLRVSVPSSPEAGRRCGAPYVNRQGETRPCGKRVKVGRCYSHDTAERRLVVDLPGEEWRPVANHPQYLVSNYGRMVKSNRASWLLSQSPTNRGYFKVGYRDSQVYVHIAVCIAFRGPKPFPKAVVRHLDDDQSNNHAENLAWGSYTDNNMDAIRNGGNTNVQRTHCPHGHLLDGQVLQPNGRVWRRCLTCHRDKERARKAAARSNRKEAR